MIKECLYCEKEFEGEKRRKYCSVPCSKGDFKRKRIGHYHSRVDVVQEKPCEECSKVFQKKHQESLARFEKKRFCSKTCSAKNSRRKRKSSHDFVYGKNTAEYGNYTKGPRVTYTSDLNDLIKD